MEYVHGGDVYSHAELQGGKALIDLSANINPYGVPAAVKRAMLEAVEDCVNYPDPFSREARRAIGESENVDPDWIYCGAGASDVLDRLAAALSPGNVLIPVPAFSEYERTLPGRRLIFYKLLEKENFEVTQKILKELSPELDAVYICSPNNPTGLTVDPELMLEISKRCLENRTWLVADECFIDFLADAGSHTLKGSLAGNPYLVVLCSYTKMFAIPGVRFGWCMSSNPRLIEALYRVGQPWNVSVFAQKCAVAASKEGRFVSDTVKLISEERSYLQRELESRGYRVFPGEANFILFNSEDENLSEKLIKQGILIRDCSNYRGLRKGFYRIAVKTRKESDAFLSAFSK